MRGRATLRSALLAPKRPSNGTSNELQRIKPGHPATFPFQIESHMSRLQTLVGQSVRIVRSLHGYHRLGIGEAGLSVYVPLHVLKNDRTVELKDVIGLTIQDIIECDTEVVINLDEGFKIKIDLRLDGYICPEGMVLTEDGFPMVVW